MKKICIYSFLIAIAVATAYLLWYRFGGTDFNVQTKIYFESVNTKDWSDTNVFSIEEPYCAYLNVSGVWAMPRSKEERPQKCEVTYVDNNGNCFTKNAEIKAQGQTSLCFEKRNIALSFREKGDKTEMAFGNWVSQEEFHLKAYYLDCFRCIGAIGYKLYDQVHWGWDNPQDRALCHPDGFPCIVYLNDRFYGIYSWQLIKHRKNMGLDKSAEDQVWLDGVISSSTLFDGEIKWDEFDIRNPKKKGDSAKPYIESLSHYCQELDSLLNLGIDSAEMRNQISKRIDVETSIDYICLMSITGNSDGYAKNWQWVTRDGRKWEVYPYDLDSGFGYNLGHCLRRPDESAVMEPGGLMQWVWLYFFDDIKEKYYQLRKSGIFSAENILTMVDEWQRRVGLANYDQEWRKWPNSVCRREMVFGNHWKLAEKIAVDKTIRPWSSDSIYHRGDIVTLDWLNWEAIGTCRGEYPWKQYGYFDSRERLETWIEERLKVEDFVFSYDSQRSEENL